MWSLGTWCSFYNYLLVSFILLCRSSDFSFRLYSASPQEGILYEWRFLKSQSSELGNTCFSSENQSLPPLAPLDLPHHVSVCENIAASISYHVFTQFCLYHYAWHSYTTYSLDYICITGHFRKWVIA